MKLFGENLDEKYGGNIPYNTRLEWEKFTLNATYYYQAHEKRLEEEGFDRAPTPAEYYELIIANLEGRLDSKTSDLAKSVQYETELTCYGAVVGKNTLEIYEYITGIEISGFRAYCKGPQCYKGIEKFDIKGIERGRVSIGDLTHIPGLIELMFSREFAKLPQYMQKNSTIYFPDSSDFMVIGREGKDNDPEHAHCINIGIYHAASRGVKEL